MSLRQASPNLANGASLFGVGAGCDCLWANGDYAPGGDGQASHLGGAIMHGAKAADDFYLCEGYVYDLESISAVLINNSFTADLHKAKLEIYADCNGCPDYVRGPLYVLEKGTKQQIGPANTDGYIPYEWTFRPSAETLEKNQNIVLKGGTYWISVYGLTDGLCQSMNMCDASFWGVTNMVKGSVAKKIFGTPTGQWNQFSFSGPWTSVEDCCVGCTDLAFTVCAKPCKILIDNGVARRQSTPSDIVGSISQFAPVWSTFDSRSADDFVVPPCDGVRICYVEGCVYTNCRGFEGALEFYGNNCRFPSYSLGGSPIGGQTIKATKVTDLGFDVLQDNRSYDAYLLEFHDINLSLPDGGKQYWLSIGVKHTFSLNERAYFCYNDDCDRDCLIRFNPGHVLTKATSVDPAYTSTNGWKSVGNDFSFLIAIESATTGSGNATPACAADFDRDGTVNVVDLFGFLGAWFAGCP